MSRSFWRNETRRRYSNKFVRQSSSKRVRKIKGIIPNGNYFRKLTKDCGQDIYVPYIESRKGFHKKIISEKKRITFKGKTLELNKNDDIVKRRKSRQMSKHTSIPKKYFEHPEQYIPKGLYCCKEKYVCPFWDIISTLPSQYSGYCHFLKIGDLDIAKETTFKNLKTGEVSMGNEMPFPVGLLWDQCKECDVNVEDEDDEDDYT